MPVQVRNPTSQVEYTGTWDKTTSMWTYVDDHPDSGTPPTDYLQHGTTAGYLTLGFGTAFTLPSYASNISVAVKMYVYEATSGVNRLYGRLGVGGSKYNSTAYDNPTTTNALYTYTWTTNPKSGVAWTVDDINGSGANALDGFGTYTSDANPAWRLASIQLEVTYDAIVNAAAAITSTATLTATASVVPVKMASASITSTATLTATASVTGGIYAQATLASLAALSANALTPSLSTYLANKLLDHVLGEGARNYAPPTLYLSLHTASPGDTGANEWTDANYSRQGIDFGVSSGGRAISSIQAQFPKPAVQATITHWGLWDSASGGNFLLSGYLVSSTVPTTHSPTLVAGEVKVVVE